MSAVFDNRYVKRLDGPNVKKGKNKKDLAEQLIEDMRRFKKENGCDRLVMVWCGSTEVFLTETPAHATVAAFEAALEANDDSIPSSMIYTYAALREGIPYANAAPNLSGDVPAMLELAAKNGCPVAGKDLKTGQTWMKTLVAPGLKAACSASKAGTRPTSSATGTERCSTIRSRSRRRKRARSRFSTTSCSRISIRSSTATSITWCGSTTIRRAGITKKAGTTSTSSAG